MRLHIKHNDQDFVSDIVSRCQYAGSGKVSALWAFVGALSPTDKRDLYGAMGYHIKTTEGPHELHLAIMQHFFLVRHLARQQFEHSLTLHRLIWLHIALASPQVVRLAVCKTA